MTAEEQLALFDNDWRVVLAKDDEIIVRRLHESGLLDRRKKSGRTPPMYRLASATQP